MTFTNSTDGFNWISSFYNNESKQTYDESTYKLDRMVVLASIFNNPQNSFKTIHIAGSKGKGSTAYYISSILTQCGLKTGLYTSPHITSFAERITDSGKLFDEEVYISEINRIAQKQSLIYKEPIFKDTKPTVFELLTLLAFLIFKKTECQYVVLETGLGGRLDSTNIVTPILSIITPIELEHTEFLGNTLEKIAFEKGGIIKKEIPVLSAIQCDEVKNVLKDIAFKKDSLITFLDEDILNIKIKNTLKGAIVEIDFKYEKNLNLILKNLCYIQAYNCTLAILAIKQIKLLEDIKNITTDNIIIALEKCEIKARFQLIKTNPNIIVDVAHTPKSFEVSIKTFNSIKKGKTALLFAASKDKNVEEIAKIAASSFNKVFITKIVGFKTSDNERDFNSFKKYNKKTEYIEDNFEALNEAKKFVTDKGTLLISGSFYLISSLFKGQL